MRRRKSLRRKMAFSSHADLHQGTAACEPSTKRSSAVGSGSNFFKGRLSMPGTTPAASQLDWLISSTTTMVLFCSKAIRERLRSSTWVMGAPPSVFAQRQRCQTFAAVPIASGPEAVPGQGLSRQRRAGRQRGEGPLRGGDVSGIGGKRLRGGGFVT